MTQVLYVRIDDRLMRAINRLAEETDYPKREIVEVLLARALNIRKYDTLERAIADMITDLE